MRISYAPEIELTGEEKKQLYGTLIFRDDNYYFLIGKSKEYTGLIISSRYDENWN